MHKISAARKIAFMDKVPVPFQELGFYQPRKLEGKHFMRDSPESGRYHGNKGYDNPFGPLTSLNKRVYFVNPVGDAINLILDIKDTFLKRGQSFGDRLHCAFSRVPAPW